MLTHFWTQRLPVVQSRCPAELAASLVLSMIDDLEPVKEDENDASKDIENHGGRRDSSSELVVVDFCSGSGGPIPAIEQRVNARRRYQNLKPIDFVMTDLYPHVNAWKPVAEGSPYLTYVPTSVDATNAAREDILQALAQRHRPSPDESSSPRKKLRMLRLFCLSFHHFDDVLARRVLLDAMESSDGFA